jgi:hypothetical protein
MAQFYTYSYNRVDGTPYYIGKGKGDRAYNRAAHCCARCPKDRARITVQYWESEEKAFEMEKWYISLFGRKDNGTGILRNMTDGGEGASGNIPSEDNLKKRSESQKGIKRPYVSLLKKGNQDWLGKTHSEETKRKMRETANSKPKAKGCTSIFKGVTLSPYGKWLASVSIARKNYHLGSFSTEEEAARVAEAARAERDSVCPLQSLVAGDSY